MFIYIHWVESTLKFGVHVDENDKNFTILDLKKKVKEKLIILGANSLEAEEKDSFEKIQLRDYFIYSCEENLDDKAQLFNDNVKLFEIDLKKNQTLYLYIRDVTSELILAEGSRNIIMIATYIAQGGRN